MTMFTAHRNSLWAPQDRKLSIKLAQIFSGSSNAVISIPLVQSIRQVSLRAGQFDSKHEACIMFAHERH